MICGASGTMTEDQPEHLTSTEARAGSASKVNRIVLFTSLILIVVAFAIILFIAR